MHLDSQLDSSAATPEFRVAIEEFMRTGAPSSRIAFGARNPPVKVERLLTMLLHRHPDLVIDAVEIEAASGCEFYRGSAIVRTAPGRLRVDFDWDCKWKAIQLGWTDYYGLPDQARAAREFGFDCFRAWLSRHEPQLAG